MKRDMELCRKILFAIEDEYVDTTICDLKIDGYSMEQVAYHCKILHDADLISGYGAQFADNHIWAFGVGALTWEGHEYLDKIRQDTVWNKTKDVITQKGLPMAVDVTKEVATAIISSMTEGAIKAMKG